MPSQTALLEAPQDFRDSALEQEDLARLLMSFRGVAAPPPASALRFVRESGDGLAPAYVFDEESGMIYILD